jgi:hypothetical protein
MAPGEELAEHCLVIMHHVHVPAFALNDELQNLIKLS